MQSSFKQMKLSRSDYVYGSSLRMYLSHTAAGAWMMLILQ